MPCPVHDGLQSVQNAGARLITGGVSTITPALRQLHWLPVRRRGDLKIFTLVYRSMAGTAPVHLADECTLRTLVMICWPPSFAVC